ncbi:hypothetical protein K438DRAFT_1926256 [Mycena galopus ATCC 62051]|nr:hypothetical protein K438DRAFT_1926256 [Mycena galopus ATCC 62051]
MLHIKFHFLGKEIADWYADALEALVPYVVRIETLQVIFRAFGETRWLPQRTVEALLNSNLEFPVLRTLRVRGLECGCLRLPLSAPRLRTLDVEQFYPSNWDTLLSAGLEDISLARAGCTVETLLDVFDHCPQAQRLMMDCDEYVQDYEDDFFEEFTRRRPLAPALRVLELHTQVPDLGRIFKAGFSDVVLHTVTGRLYNGDIVDFAEALLPGVGPLVAFSLDYSGEIELRDEHGRIRRLQLWSENEGFPIQWVWEYLSVHYDLHKTVREIRIAEWDDYAEVFRRYPPQQDAITLVIAVDWGFCVGITQTMSIPGLVKLEFTDDCLRLLAPVFAHIEPTARKVEVCVHSSVTELEDVLQPAVSGDCWALCGQCRNGEKAQLPEQQTKQSTTDEHFFIRENSVVVS